ncbi:MAG: hypothetical protein IPI60_14855 [Saprospiraceae bacterium]|nr:hypothetical protein [Saprospiraceae bacterium]
MKQFNSINLLCLMLVFLTACNEKPQILEAQVPPPYLIASVKTNNSNNFLNIIWPDSTHQISEYIREIFEDKKGNLWFGTNGDGVCKYDGKFLQYFNVNEGFSGGAVRGIAEDSSGNLWFATDGGVCRWDGKEFTKFTTADGLASNDIWSLMIDSGGTVWVGTLAGICSFDGQFFRKFPIPAIEKDNSSRFNPDLAWCILEDKNGIIWFGMDGGGLRKYDGKSITTYTEKEGLASNNIYSILEDSKGNLWLGTKDKGITKYDRHPNDSVRHDKLFTTFSTQDGLANNSIWTISEDKTGNIWFGTGGGGASKYDGKAFTNFKEQRGHTKNHIQSITEDKYGNLWFGFSGGLYRFDGHEFINVQKKDLVDGC